MRNGESEIDLHIVRSVWLKQMNSEKFGARELGRTTLEEFLLKHLKKRRSEGAKIELQKNMLVDQRLLNRNWFGWKSIAWNRKSLEPRKQYVKKPSFLIDSWTAGTLFGNTNAEPATTSRDDQPEC